MGTQAMDLAELAGEITDPDAAISQGDYLRHFYWGAGLRIAGGTDEIMRNIIAERVLGLPGDIRVDKDVPFNKLPTGR
jgi:alkylation response protein AidB-like acyl-CoA dehydrogenase